MNTAARNRAAVKIRRWWLSLYYGFWIPPYDGMMDERRCRFLYSLALRYPSSDGDVAVEVGVFKGCSTAWLAAASRRSAYPALIAVDLFTGTASWGETWDTYAEFMLRLKRNALTDFVRVERGDSRTVAERWLRETQAAQGACRAKIGFLHIDADHSAAAASGDVMAYLPLMSERGIIVLDDHDAMHPGVIQAGELLEAYGYEMFESVPERADGSGGSAAFRKKMFYGKIPL